MTTQKEVRATRKELVFRLKHMINDIDAEAYQREAERIKAAGGIVDNVPHALSLDHLRLLLWECIQSLSANPSRKKKVQ